MPEIDPSKKVADRYLKREVLGEGTYGVVYKAIDTKVSPIVSSFLCRGRKKFGKQKRKGNVGG